MSEHSSDYPFYPADVQSSNQPGSELKRELVHGNISENPPIPEDLPIPEEDLPIPEEDLPIPEEDDSSAGSDDAEANNLLGHIDEQNIEVEGRREPGPNQYWTWCLALIIIVGGVIVVAAIILLIVGLYTRSKPTYFSATASEIAETVLIGTTTLAWFKSVTISNNEDLLNEQVCIWLADQLVTTTQDMNVPESLSYNPGFIDLYAFQNSTFSFEFLNVTGPPGYEIELRVVESSDASNVPCMMTFTDADGEHTEYLCQINQTGYYDVKFNVSSGVSGTVNEYFKIVKLNHTFYSSSSNPLCVLDNTNSTCSLPTPAPALPVYSKQYLVAFLPSGLAPTFTIKPNGRNELFSIAILSLVPLVVLCLVCLCYVLKKRQAP